MNTTLTTPRCIECGKFVATEDPDARHYFEPDNHFGPEIIEWTCGPCKRHAAHLLSEAMDAMQAAEARGSQAGGSHE